MATEIGPGTLLAGRFALEDLLDESSGARVWRATDQTLARSVTVHVLAADDPRAASLLGAARTSATVPDGHLLRVLDAASVDGIAYVVNEWGSGVSLDRLLAEGPLSPRRAAWVVKEVAEAITTAHRHGIAHGRLVPENVMVTDSGGVKLIGFVIDAVLRGRERTLVTGGAPLDEHESDVVNLGALLYAGLVGKWPGTTGSALPAAPTEHGRPLRPRRVRAGVPRPLDALCDRVLNADAHGNAPKIETAHEVYAALSDFIGDPAASQLGPDGGPALLGDEPGAAGTEGQPTQMHPPPGADDPDATRAGTPLFFDEHTGVGWVSAPDSRGVPGSEGPPPPPDLPEPESRPLFAPERTGLRRGRAPQPDAPTRSIGAGNGRLPDSWGPDADEQPPDDTGEWGTNGWDKEKPGRGWLKVALAVAVGILVLAGIVFAFNRGRAATPTGAPGGSFAGSVSGSTSPTGAHHVVPISSVTDFDPEGNPPSENPGEAHLAIDGNPHTAWQTLVYQGDPKLGGLKSGVGLLVDLGTKQPISRVALTLVGSPTSLQILADPNAATAPSSNSGMQVVGSADAAGPSVTITLTRPVSTRWFAVWLTSLPAVPGGYRGQIAEISVTS